MLVNLISRLQAKSSRLLVGGPRPRARSPASKGQQRCHGGFSGLPIEPTTVGSTPYLSTSATPSKAWPDDVGMLLCLP